MNTEQLNALRQLRDEGYAIVVFTPDELGDACPDDVESRLIELGWDVIDTLRQEPKDE